MRLPAIIYFIDEDPIVGELEGMPDPSANFITLFNPRRRDGRTAPFLDNSAEMVMFAWHRISHVQLIPKADLEPVIGFVRE